MNDFPEFIDVDEFSLGGDDDGYHPHWILDGRTPVPCDLTTWAKWYQDPTKRVVEQTFLGEGFTIMVSTICNGYDSSWGSGPPILFETMVFGGELDGEMDRYCTYDQAEIGHAEMVAKVKATLPAEAEIEK